MFPILIERVTFDNGYEISVIKGPGTYSDSDTFEVAIISPEGNVMEPEGYVTKVRLEKIKNKVKNKRGVQCDKKIQ
jgi:hypothetical protein